MQYSLKLDDDETQRTDTWCCSYETLPETLPRDDH